MEQSIYRPSNQSWFKGGLKVVVRNYFHFPVMEYYHIYCLCHKIWSIVQCNKSDFNMRYFYVLFIILAAYLSLIADIFHVKTYVYCTETYIISQRHKSTSIWLLIQYIPFNIGKDIQFLVKVVETLDLSRIQILNSWFLCFSQ